MLAIRAIRTDVTFLINDGVIDQVKLETLAELVDNSIIVELAN